MLTCQKLLAAAKENPGKRNVMLVEIENLDEVLKSNTSIQLVDIESWLHRNIGYCFVL
jgi:hypothetical protein